MKKFIEFFIPSFSILGTSIILFITFGGNDLNEQLLLLGLRRTARFSLLLFLVPYVSRPFYLIKKNKISRFLLKYRKEFGIGFGFSFFSHIALISLLFYTHSGSELPESIGLDDFLIGIPGIVFVILMLITSFQAIKPLISIQLWSRIHLIGLHFVWIIFFLCLLSKIIFPKKNFHGLDYYPYIILLILAFLMRIFSFYNSNKKVIQ